MDLEFEDLLSGDCSVIILLTYSHIKTINNYFTL